MEWNLTTIGALLAAMLFGYLLGLLEARLKSAKQNRPPASPPPDKIFPAPGAAPDAPPSRPGPGQPSRPPAPARVKTPKGEQSAAASQSIVAQIDQVLQKRLSGTPLAGRGIRLQEAPTGGAAVWIGLQRYDGIEAVPEPEVRDAIRQAVAEWEKRG
jgi:hypothetical protein